MANPTITYQDKSNVEAIVDRSKQSTAEDWNEVKIVVNALSRLLHVESAVVALDEELEHTIMFNEPYNNNDYCIVKLEVYTTENVPPDTFRNNLPIYSIVQYPDKITFKTYTDENLNCDYFIMPRS